MRLVLALLIIVSTQAASIYVDNTCANNGTGVTTTCAGAGGTGPYNSLANAQSAVTGNQSDNSLLFHTDQTFSGQFTVAAFGTSGHPFTIGNYGGGAKPIITGGASNINISCSGCVYILVSGIETTAATTTAGIYITQPAGHVTVYSSYIHGMTSADGIRILHSSDNTIDSNEVYSIGGSASYNGILIFKQDAMYPTTGNVISNNHVHNGLGDGIVTVGIAASRIDGSTTKIFGNESNNFSAGVYLVLTDGVEVYSNQLHNNGQDCLGTADCPSEPYGFANESSSSVSVHDNLIYNNFTTGMGIFGTNGVLGHSDSSSYYRNIVYGTIAGAWRIDLIWQNDAGTYVGSGNKIYNNIFYGGNYNFAIGDDAASVTPNLVYNNTFYGSTTNGLRFSNAMAGTAVNFTIKNNIFSACGSVCLFGEFIASGMTALNNLYYRSGGGNLLSYNTVNYTSGTIAGVDAQAITTDPTFTSTAAWTGLTLLAGSPAINAGINLGSPYDQAFNPGNTNWPLGVVSQNSFGSAWELGPFVFGAITSHGGSAVHGGTATRQ